MDVFVAYDGDGIGVQVERAALRDDVEGLAQISEGIRRANVIMTSFAVEHGGRIISSGGDEGNILVPVSVLGELPKLREMYRMAAGATVTVGVGHKLSEAGKAMLAGKIRGKDRVVLYEPSIEKELAEITKPSESEKIAEAYLKGEADPEGGKTLKRRIHEAIRQGARWDDYPVEKDAEEPMGEPDQEPMDPEPQAPEAFGEHIPEGGDKEELQGIVAGALQMMNQNAEALEALAQQAPEVYQAIVATVETMIELARYSVGGGEPGESDQQAPSKEDKDGNEGEGAGPMPEDSGSDIEMAECDPEKKK